jgi:hypothetical protein
MWNRVWGWIKKFGTFVAGAVGVLLLVAGLISDLVGRTTFIDDLVLFLQRIKPVTDFLSRQPEWVFYPICLLLILCGVASAATRWRPVLEALRKPEPVTQQAPAKKPAPAADMGFGDMLRYIAQESAWAASLGRSNEWPTLLEREVIDRMHDGAVRSKGRFRASYDSSTHVPAASWIESSFWNKVALKIGLYFMDPVDKNTVEGEDYGYFDIKVVRADVERAWPKADPETRNELEGLEAALEARRDRMDQ